jgi:hypothetical protein
MRKDTDQKAVRINQWFEASFEKTADVNTRFKFLGKLTKKVDETCPTVKNAESDVQVGRLRFPPS